MNYVTAWVKFRSNKTYKNKITKLWRIRIRTETYFSIYLLLYYNHNLPLIKSIIVVVRQKLVDEHSPFLGGGLGHVPHLGQLGLQQHVPEYLRQGLRAGPVPV